jgi:hypothetical protein
MVPMSRFAPPVAKIGPVVSIELERVEGLELVGMTLAHLKDAEARAEMSLRVALLMAIRDKLASRSEGGKMSYSDAEVLAASSAMDKYRGGEEGEAGSALVVVGLSAERAAKEVGIRDDTTRVVHRAGASIRQLADVSGLVRKTLRAIVSSESRLHD